MVEEGDKPKSVAPVTLRLKDHDNDARRGVAVDIV